VDINKEHSGGLVLGIDASRNRSGGAKAHLIGIMTQGDPLKHGIREVHIWAYRSLLDSIPDRPWLMKHSPSELEQSLLKQIWWQRFRFSAELRKAGCAVVLNTDAGTVSTFRPLVTMSRDMLSYEPGEIERFGFSKARLRLILLRFMQNRSLRDCDGAIFLTHHAADVIQKSCGALARVAYIPHGVGSNFKQTSQIHPWPFRGEREILCLYISPIWEFKHQWVVVRAVAALRKRGVKIKLLLIGGGNVRARALLNNQLAESDPNREFVQVIGRVKQEELPLYLANADLFIFASSCENMPNTLLEAMAAGLPIACSDRGPMPEILEDGGMYFDPENDVSVACAIERLIKNPALRQYVAQRAKYLSEKYSWARCADETFDFIANTFHQVRKEN
jgi:glycosyltransferase involved in cell wall biosynthesis